MIHSFENTNLSIDTLMSEKQTHFFIQSKNGFFLNRLLQYDTTLPEEERVHIEVFQITPDSFQTRHSDCVDFYIGYRPLPKYNVKLGSVDIDVDYIVNFLKKNGKLLCSLECKLETSGDFRVCLRNAMNGEVIREKVFAKDLFQLQIPQPSAEQMESDLRLRSGYSSYTMIDLDMDQMFMDLSQSPEDLIECLDIFSNKVSFLRAAAERLLT